MFLKNLTEQDFVEKDYDSDIRAVSGKIVQKETSSSGVSASDLLTPKWFMIYLSEKVCVITYVPKERVNRIIIMTVRPVYCIDR